MTSRSEPVSSNERMTTAEACRLIVDLFTWDEKGAIEPKPPYRWETVARIASDYAKGALADSALEPTPRYQEGCKCTSGALQPDDACPLHGDAGPPPPPIALDIARIRDLLLLHYPRPTVDELLNWSSRPPPAEHPDSARYKWLANRVLYSDYGDNGRWKIGWGIRQDLRDGAQFMYGPSIDIAIDEAMAASRPTKEVLPARIGSCTCRSVGCGDGATFVPSRQCPIHGAGAA